MSIKTKLLSAATVAALITAPAAFAWEDGEISTVFVEQVQLDNTWSDLNVHVGEYAASATAASTSVGNASAGLLKGGDIDYDAFQTNNGHAIASSALEGGNVGHAASVTTAYGNSSTGGTWMGNSFYRAEQEMNGDTAAVSTINLGNVNDIASATTAAANVSVSSSEFGDNRAFQIQESNGNVHAETDADLCCANNSAVFLTTASGNVGSSSGSTSTSINGAVQTTAEHTYISSVSDVYMHDGNNVIAQATGSGNSYVLSNEWGYASLGRDGSEVFQGNSADISAESYVTLDHWSGHAASSAYGVGNSVAVSNVGSDTNLFANQDNSGDVYTASSFTGQSWVGGTGIATATSIGNAASAHLCNTCGDAALGGAVNQVNSGTITASTSMNVPYAGHIIGTATAIGNSATFQSSGD